MSSAGFEECAHKLAKLDIQEGYEMVRVSSRIALNVVRDMSLVWHFNREKVTANLSFSTLCIDIFISVSDVYKWSCIPEVFHSLSWLMYYLFSNIGTL